MPQTLTPRQSPTMPQTIEDDAAAAAAATTPDRFKPCDCCDFRPHEWPDSNATLHIRPCMRRCPYCGVTVADASKLRRHLTKILAHEAQNLMVVPVASGRVMRIRKRNVENLPRLTRPTRPTRTPRVERPPPTLPLDTKQPSSPKQPQPDNQTPETHQDQIRYMEREKFDLEVIKTFKELKLSTPADISPEVTQLWKDYNSRVPSIIDARRCWAAERPTDAKLFAATIEQLRSPTSTCTVIRRGEPTNDISAAIEAIGQLVYPHRWNPLKLVDLRSDILPDGIFSLPKGVVHAYEVDNLQVMLTPKYYCTQLHFDNSDGLSSIIGETGLKIFATFPNTPHNTSLFRSTGNNEAKLEMIGPNLEGGLTFPLTSTSVIDLPCNCFHAVWTLEGCFLAALDFTTPASVGVYAHLLSSEVDELMDPERQRDLFDWFINAFEVAWRNHHVDDAIAAWLMISDRLTGWASTEPTFLEEATKVAGTEVWCSINPFGETRPTPPPNPPSRTGKRGRASASSAPNGVNVVPPPENLYRQGHRADYAVPLIALYRLIPPYQLLWDSGSPASERTAHIV
ncbi:hypothetical protein V502_06708 [Pseudogymnoascus sp. VKM F-4520 (FW-2644)]|nr:hypothetical protein V502_06708 [Pseudogymnoascus sp. VKM F-4520 (FW-2644)]